MDILYAKNPSADSWAQLREAIGTRNDYNVATGIGCEVNSRLKKIRGILTADYSLSGWESIITEIQRHTSGYFHKRSVDRVDYSLIESGYVSKSLTEALRKVGVSVADGWFEDFRSTLKISAGILNHCICMSKSSWNSPDAKPGKTSL